MKKPPEEALPEWVGRNRDEVKSAFSHLTPKTEPDRLSYRDSDPIPTPARCSVIPCYPTTGKRVDCRYTFRFRGDTVVSATRSGNCRAMIPDRTHP